MAQDKAVVFKHEDEVKGQAVGPVWVRDEQGRMRSYQDGPHGTKWFTLDKAELIAFNLSLPLEQE